MRGFVPRLGLIVVFLLLGLSQSAKGDFPIPPSSGHPDLAVLPFTNYSEEGRAAEILVPLIEAELTKREVDFVGGDPLREILRRHRIRSADRIRPVDARAIREETGIEFLLLGSYDIFLNEGRPEVGLSARIVQVPSLRIVRAASCAASGEDFAGLFEIGRIDSVAAVAGRVVQDLFRRLDQEVRLRKRPDGVGVLRSPIVIVPFDNASTDRYAGEVVTQIALSHLVEDGYSVVEPGLVNELFVRNRTIPRGEIDFPMVERLAEAFSPEYLLTGVVESFKPARGVSIEVTPSVEITARLIQASTGRILLAWEESREGRDSETVLGFGRRYSIGRLVDSSIGRLVGRMENAEQKLLKNEE